MRPPGGDDADQAGTLRGTLRVGAAWCDPGVGPKSVRSCGWMGGNVGVCDRSTGGLGDMGHMCGFCLRHRRNRAIGIWVVWWVALAGVGCGEGGAGSPTSPTASQFDITGDWDAEFSDSGDHRIRSARIEGWQCVYDEDPNGKATGSSPHGHSNWAGGMSFTQTGRLLKGYSFVFESIGAYLPGVLSFTYEYRRYSGRGSRSDGDYLGSVSGNRVQFAFVVNKQAPVWDPQYPEAIGVMSDRVGFPAVQYTVHYLSSTYEGTILSPLDMEIKNRRTYRIIQNADQAAACEVTLETPLMFEKKR